MQIGPSSCLGYMYQAHTCLLLLLKIWTCETFSTQYMFLLCCIIHTVNYRNRHCSICSPTILHQPSGYNPFPSTFYSLPEGTMRTKLVNGHSSWMLCCNAWWEIMWVVAEVCHCLTIRSPDGTACTMQHYAVNWRSLMHTGTLDSIMQFICFVFMSSELMG